MLSRLGDLNTRLDAACPRTEREEAAAAGWARHLPVEVQIPPRGAGAFQDSPPLPAYQWQMLPSAEHNGRTFSASARRQVLLPGEEACYA